MIFSCAIGSMGTIEECYSINFPMVLSPDCNINVGNINSKQMIDGLKYTLKKHQHLYTLKIDSFNSAQDARSYLKRLSASLRWVSLKNKIGIKFPTEIHELKITNNPITVSEQSSFYKIIRDNGWTAIDGEYDVEKLTIIPEHKKLLCFESGRPSVIIGFNTESFFKNLEEGILFPSLEKILGEKKLCLAIELYSAYQFEISTTAKFVKLITVIESLLPDLDIPEHVLPILDKAKQVLKDERKAAKTRGEDTEALDRLMSRLGGLKRQSIGSTMVYYMSDCLEEFPELGNSNQIITKLKRLYEIRSALLHDGEFEEAVLQTGVVLLSELVPKLLMKLYIKCAS